MLESDALHLDCQTCLAANTTACEGCVVSHVLANDDGPIELIVAPSPPSASERAIALFAKAGLLDDPPTFLSMDEFETPGRIGAVR